MGGLAQTFQTSPAELIYYASLQFFGQAIEEASTLDQDTIRDVMAAKTLDTAMGSMKFDKIHLNMTFPGHIGQWQNGSWEIIDPGEKENCQTDIPEAAMATKSK